MEKIESLTDELTRALIAEGKIIEAGFAAYRLVVIPEGAPQVQLDESRFAFMAGAQHLFGSIMVGLSPDAEPTAADLEVMGKIAAELAAFTEEMRRRIQ